MFKAKRVCDIRAEKGLKEAFSMSGRGRGAAVKS